MPVVYNELRRLGGSALRRRSPEFINELIPAEPAHVVDLLVLDEAITSYATIERKWNFARAWRRRELGSGGAGEGAVE
jgi:hypothetical protein